MAYQPGSPQIAVSKKGNETRETRELPRLLVKVGQVGKAPPPEKPREGLADNYSPPSRPRKWSCL